MGNMDRFFESALLAALLKNTCSDEKRNIEVMALKIVLTPLGVSCQTTGSKSAIRELELEDVVKEFSSDISDVAKKYTNIVIDKIKKKAGEYDIEITEKEIPNYIKDIVNNIWIENKKV